MSDSIDPVELGAALIRCPSVTPDEAGALTVLRDVLEPAGFHCERVDRNGIANMFARWGEKGARKTIGFNGHIDVVPPGDVDAWTEEPFSGVVRDGLLWGRGAADMKTGVAAFAAAAAEFVREAPPNGAVILAITGDEEREAADGTVALLDWMEAEGEQMSACLVGEPTCSERMGDTIKIGRRGSMNARLKAIGVQGHSAYPHMARNPVPALARLMDRLAFHELDAGTEFFDPSTLAVMSIDTGNPAGNVIPATCEGTLNIRFNDLHTAASLTAWLREETGKVADETGIEFELETKASGESFVFPAGALSKLVSTVVEAETGISPRLSTSGGTSDARFIKNHCPVVEFGLVGATMHQTDERVEIEQVRKLKAVYKRILEAYFD